MTPVKRLFDHFGYEECWNQVDAYMAEGKLSALGLCCTSRVEDKKFQIYAGIHGRMDDDFARTVPYIIEQVDNSKLLDACLRERRSVRDLVGKRVYIASGDSRPLQSAGRSARLSSVRF